MNKLLHNQFLLNQKQRVGSDFESWRNNGGGNALLKAINDPDSIIQKVKISGLQGFGGSGFPAYKKFNLIKEQVSSTKYLICNGNEDEPDAIKDELLIRETPFQLIEGALIVALACDIDTIIFYINKNYDKCLSVLQNSISLWEKSDLRNKLSINIKIKLIPSPGDYISGEETAAIESLESKFSLPRIKPPFPMTNGLHGLPTLVNNIETICNIPHILNSDSRYNLTKLYTLCGDINFPGVYELPLGTSLHNLIYDYGMNADNSSDLYAVIIGGESCVILTENSLNAPLDYSKGNDFSLGSAVVRVIRNKEMIFSNVYEYISFYSNESCGQCPSCKIGTENIRKIFSVCPDESLKQSDVIVLAGMVKVLANSGRCHLIDGAVNLTSSFLKKVCINKR